MSLMDNKCEKNNSLKLYQMNNFKILFQIFSIHYEKNKDMLQYSPIFFSIELVLIEFSRIFSVTII